MRQLLRRFFKDSKLCISALGAFYAHFILYRNDATPDRKLIQLLLKISKPQFPRLKERHLKDLKDNMFKDSIPIDMEGRVFANGPGDRGSIPSRVIQKSKKCHLILPCLTLSIIRYGSKEQSRIKWIKWSKDQRIKWSNQASRVIQKQSSKSSHTKV